MEGIWRAIANEAALAAEHIGMGVTALGRANYAHRAYYPESFFALSVGFERSAKLAIVLDHAINNEGTFPEEKVYRQFGHDLQRLMLTMAEVAKRHGDNDGEVELPESEIQKAMLKVLSDFASNVTRYYNLDVLSGRDAAEDPIAAWDRRVTRAVLAAHYTTTARERRERGAQAVGHMMDGISVVRHESESGERLTSAEPAARRTGEIEFARPWERMYLLQFARFIYLTMDRLTRSGKGALQERLPYLSEFFAIYYKPDDYFRSRKTWSIYKP